MVEFLQDKFFSHINPRYIIKEIKEHEVHLERVKSKRKTAKQQMRLPNFRQCFSCLNPILLKHQQEFVFVTCASVAS